MPNEGASGRLPEPLPSLRLPPRTLYRRSGHPQLFSELGRKQSKGKTGQHKENGLATSPVLIQIHGRHQGIQNPMKRWRLNPSTQVFFVKPAPT